MQFSPQPLGEWMDCVDAEPTPRWLLKHFIPDDSLTMITGLPKGLGRKSLLAMVQGLSLATGKPIAQFAPASQLPVLYCYHEDARKPTSQRFHMLCNGAGIDKKGLKDFWLSHRSLMDLRSKADVQLIGSWCRDNKVGLVVFDTLAKSMQGDEDSSENIGRVIRGVEEARSFGLSVLLLHHLTKSPPSMVGGNYDPDRDMRGSSALSGAYETHQAVRHYSYNNKHADLLVSNKDGAEFAHKHRWEFSNTLGENGEIDIHQAYTKLHMGPRLCWDDVGLLDADETGELMAGLDIGMCYTVDMLAAVWKVSRPTAYDLTAKLAGMQKLESAKFGYRIKEG